MKRVIVLSLAAGLVVAGGVGILTARAKAPDGLTNAAPAARFAPWSTRLEPRKRVPYTLFGCTARSLSSRCIAAG